MIIIFVSENLKDCLIKILHLMLQLIIYSFRPKLSYFGAKTWAELNRSCLKELNEKYTRGKILNIYIVYKLSSNLNIFDFGLENCLFGSVKLTKNENIGKCISWGYGIGFDSHRNFLFPKGKFSQNVIIFGADMSSSVHIGNKGKDILILGEAPRQGLDGTTLTVEKKYSINFTVRRRKFLFKFAL